MDLALIVEQMTFQCALFSICAIFGLSPRDTFFLLTATTLICVYVSHNSCYLEEVNVWRQDILEFTNIVIIFCSQGLFWRSVRFSTQKSCCKILHHIVGSWKILNSINNTCGRFTSSLLFTVEIVSNHAIQRKERSILYFPRAKRFVIDSTIPEQSGCDRSQNRKNNGTNRRVLSLQFGSIEIFYDANWTWPEK